MRTKTLRLQAETGVEHCPDFPEHLPENPVVISTDHICLRLDAGLVQRLVCGLVEQEGRGIHRLEIVLTGTEEMRKLNREWREADYETDVLCFSLGDGTAIDAEVYVSLDFAQASCLEHGVTFTQEASRYIVHGLLHACGYEDNTPESREVMRKKEDYYLRCAGLSDT